MGIMKTYLFFVDKLNRGVKIILAAMMAGMSALVIAQVFCRLAHVRLPWSEELARYLMIYVSFIGTGYAVRFDLMMRITFLQDAVSPGKRRFLSIAANLIMLGFSALILVHGVSMVQRVHGQLAPALQTPMSIPYASVVAGSLLMILNAVTVIAERLAGKENSPC